MLRRLSEWYYHDGGSYHGTPWDPRDKDWEPGRVEYEWCMSEDGTWVQNSTRYRVVELFYDASDNDLPLYEEPHVETTFLTTLPHDVVLNLIWPQVIQGCAPLQSIQAMVRVRRVCRGWQMWVDNSVEWRPRVQGFLLGAAGSGRPWHASPGKLKAVREAAQERELAAPREC